MILEGLLTVGGFPVVGHIILRRYPRYNPNIDLRRSLSLNLSVSIPVNLFAIILSILLGKITYFFLILPSLTFSLHILFAVIGKKVKISPKERETIAKKELGVDIDEKKVLQELSEVLSNEEIKYLEQLEKEK
ncbi:MAG: hypothetical protein ACE5K4_01445 [Candidatus Hydrothermarchaeota archaeon]